jgi:hypothetical protein
MTVEPVSTTTPVLYHNHHYYCYYYDHLVSLCLPRNIDYIQTTVLCIIQRLHRSTQGCQSRVLLLLSSHLAYCRPPTVPHSRPRLFTHPGPSNLQRISLTYTLVACECGVGIPRETSLHECIAAAAKTTSILRPSTGTTPTVMLIPPDTAFNIHTRLTTLPSIPALCPGAPITATTRRPARKP